MSAPHLSVRSTDQFDAPDSRARTDPLTNLTDQSLRPDLLTNLTAKPHFARQCLAIEAKLVHNWCCLGHCVAKTSSHLKDVLHKGRARSPLPQRLPNIYLCVGFGKDFEERYMQQVAMLRACCGQGQPSSQRQG